MISKIININLSAVYYILKTYKIKSRNKIIYYKFNYAFCNLILKSFKIKLIV